jgi:radical SAM family uncharacterized protein/radical SAM-linked protein
MTSAMTTGRHPYESFVHRVQKPARYLGGEFGARPKDWSAVSARVCLAFPDVYDIGMSHLGFKILYKILNDDPRTLAERAYAPWTDMEAELRQRAVPLVSCETARPLRDFDMVGFSLQFELTYTNILTMLDLGGIPLRAEARTLADPLVAAGGPTATHPEPLAGIVDAVVIGDGEKITTDLALAWVEARGTSSTREEALRKIATLPGVYVPSLYTTTRDEETGFEVVAAPRFAGVPFPVTRNLLADLDEYPFPDDGPVGGPEAIFDRMSIEIARGCTEGCRFCQAGMIYRPVRERDPEKVVETLVSAVKKSGYDEASLTSLSTADYSCVAPLVKKVVDRLAPERVSLGVSSLRAYGLAEDVLDDLQRVRATGVTFAPEAGSQRMRDVVNKNVTEAQLMETAERIFSRGWESMKLYFMIGLPTEEESDVREIPRVGGRAREVGRRLKGRPPTITVSVSTHVPKPHTPFQWCAMDPIELVREKQSWLREEARSNKVDLRVHDSTASWLEGVFARGDRRLSSVLLRAYELGCRFDSWDEHQRLELWQQAFDEHGIDVGPFLGTLPVTARLPWDHIDVGLEDGFLLREYRKALKSRLSPPCGKVAGTFVHATNLQEAAAETKKLVCYDCGVACDLTAMRDDRLVKLRKLGAVEPREPKVVESTPRREREAASDSETAAAPPKAAPRTKQGQNKPKGFEQGEGRRYRFRFTKIGPTAFLSHLDLARAIPRSFRRAEVPMFYTQGFHPKPDMVFAPALSLGIASLDEYVDLKLVADVDPNEVAAGLSGLAQDGLRFFGGARLGGNDPALGKVIDVARYVVALPSSSLAQLGGLRALEERLGAFAETSEAVVLRRIDGVGKKVNVRQFVRAAVANADFGHGALERAGMLGDYTHLTVDIDVGGNGSAKIAEFMEALLRREGEEFDAGAAPSWLAIRAALGLRREALAASPRLERLMEIVSPVDLVAISDELRSRRAAEASRIEGASVALSAE